MEHDPLLPARVLRALPPHRLTRAFPGRSFAQARQDIAELRALCAGEGDAIAIGKKLQMLEQSAYQVAEAMYGSEGDAAAASADASKQAKRVTS